jgi:hypothetical protein
LPNFKNNFKNHQILHQVLVGTCLLFGAKFQVLKFKLFLFHIPLFVGGGEDQQILIGLFKFENNLSHFKSDFGFGNGFSIGFLKKIGGEKQNPLVDTNNIEGCF